MPVTLTVVATAPVVKLEGTIREMTGDGLFTTRLTAGPELLDELPLSAMMLSCAPVVSCEAGTNAVTCVLLTKLVVSSVPPTWIAVLLINPVPLTVKVVAAAPAETLAGDTEETVGATTGGVGVEPPPEGLLAQPEAKRSPKRHTTGEREKARILMEKVSVRVSPYCSQM